MKSRALRLTILTLFVGLLVGSAYIVWTQQRERAVTAAAAQAFDDNTRALERALLGVKAAQAGYVAAGQGEDFWIARVEALLAAAEESLTTLGPGAGTDDAPSEIDAVTTAFEDFKRLDRRAREYARNGQRLLASDLVFSDGTAKIEAALAALDRVRATEQHARNDSLRQARRTELLALAGAGAIGFLLVFGLTSLQDAPPPAAVGSSLPSDRAELRPRARQGDEIRVAPEPPASAPPAPPVNDLPLAPVVEVQPQAEVQPQVADKPAATLSPLLDLSGVAALCTDLARVPDTRALPAALERAAILLDAAGIVLWIADPDARELAPIIAHGYPHELMVRMGTIHRDAENVTAAAFRTGLIQTIGSDTTSAGAIAAPLLTPAGPVGVMAAEILHDGERRDSTRAVAAILAAQLATLVGPPATRAATSEAAAGA